MDDYAPKSPDLSALDNPTNDSIPAPTSNAFAPFDSHQQHTYNPPPLHQTPLDTHARESFSLPPGAASAVLPGATPTWQQSYSHQHPSHSESQPQYGDPHAQPPHPQPQLNQDPSTHPAPKMPGKPRGRPRRNAQKPAPTYQENDSEFDPASPSAEADYPLSPTPPPPATSNVPSSSLNQLQDPYSQPLLQDQVQPQDIVIKTRFPLARIKRIVQADEDVGKVAQATPVAVAKALEQFMVQLAMSSAAASRGRGSRRVTAGDMKVAVGREGVFDFLEGVVGRIGDIAAAKEGKGGKGKAESSPDVDSGGGAGGVSEMEGVEGGAGRKGKKRGRGASAAAGGAAPRRRKKKAAGDDD